MRRTLRTWTLHQCHDTPLARIRLVEWEFGHNTFYGLVGWHEVGQIVLGAYRLYGVVPWCDGLAGWRAGELVSW